MALFPGRGFPDTSSVDLSTPDTSRWIQILARLGYAARGVVYLIIGGIALQAALTSVRSPEDSSGALLVILRQPLGIYLLWVTVVGLTGFVFWRLVQAFRDPENKGTDAKGIIVRAGYFVSALLYGALALEATRMLLGSSSGSGGDDQSTDHWTAVAMSQPAGRWIVAAAGVIVILVGVRELYRSYKADLSSALDISRLEVRSQRNVVRCARAGMAARGVVFGIIGWFLITAALQQDPTEAQGFESALTTLGQQPYGSILLAAVAVGLFAFGLFELIESRYRRIRPE